jgi:inhibitor of KinA
MKPSLRQIGPNIIELFWVEKPTDLLLKHILCWELEITSQFGIEIIEIRKGFQTLTCLMKNELNRSALDEWNVFLKSDIELFQLSDKVWNIPVCYDPRLGKDLKTLADSKSLDIEKLVKLHSQASYRIHFFGFLPGFMYLNGLDPALHFPRKSVPDRQMEAGSVAIGGAQTGIYPNESPGGWHVIGRTPISLFNPEANPPVFAKPGERIKFIPIDLEEYDQQSQNSTFPTSHD